MSILRCDCDSQLCHEFGCEFYEEWKEPQPMGDTVYDEHWCKCNAKETDFCPRVDNDEEQ